MVKFNIGGLSFGLCFVTVSKASYDRLIDIAYDHHVEISDFGRTEDSEQLLSYVSAVGGEEDSLVSKAGHIHGFLRDLKAEDCWLQDRDTVNNERVMIFYHKEALA